MSYPRSPISGPESLGVQLSSISARCFSLSALITVALWLVAPSDKLNSAQAEGLPAAVQELVVIDSETGEPYRSVRLAMLQSLAESGYRDGENLRIIYQSLDNHVGVATSFWNHLELKNRKIFFINGTVAAGAFQKLAWNDSEHLFVYAAVTDPVGMGLVDDFKSSPKANFTGVAYPVPVKERFRMILQLFPKARTFGLIYADMPQSHSYRRWIEELLRTDKEFKGISVQFRMVPFVAGSGGHVRMAMLAEEYVRELDGDVDVFISPNDQMGVQSPYATMLSRIASKPLIGIGTKEVLENWGATASISPSLQMIGKQAAAMVRKLLDGKPIRQIPPEPARAFEITIDVSRAKAFGAELPRHWSGDASVNLVQRPAR